MMQDMNPCKIEKEEESSMNVPDGSENEKKPFIPPVDMTDISFIKLAEKMKKLSEETLDMIRRDLQPDSPNTKQKVDVEEKDIQTPEGDAKIVKVEAKDMTPAELLI